MTDFWTATRNSSGYEKLVEPVSWILSEEMDYSEPVRILDIGTGNGRAFEKFQSRLEKETGEKIDSVGLDPQEIIYENRNGLSTHSVKGMGENIPLKNGSMDLVVSNYLLPFLDSEKQSEILQEVERVVQPESAVALHVEPMETERGSIEITSHWVLNYEDYKELSQQTENFSNYPLTPPERTNALYSDNRGKLPKGFYDRFRDEIGKEF